MAYINDICVCAYVPLYVQDHIISKSNKVQSQNIITKWEQLSPVYKIGVIEALNMLSGIMLTKCEIICVQFLNMEKNSNYFHGFIAFRLYFFSVLHTFLRKKCSILSYFEN